MDVNERGQVLGTLVDADWSTRQGAVWDRGRLTLVGEPDTTVRAINNRGQVIGLTDGRPFRWRDGEVTYYGGAAGSQVVLLGMDEAGRLVGFVDNGTSRELVTWAL